MWADGARACAVTASRQHRGRVPKEHARGQRHRGAPLLRCPRDARHSRSRQPTGDDAGFVTRGRSQALSAMLSEAPPRDVVSVRQASDGSVQSGTGARWPLPRAASSPRPAARAARIRPAPKWGSAPQTTPPEGTLSCRPGHGRLGRSAWRTTAIRQTSRMNEHVRHGSGPAAAAAAAGSAGPRCPPSSAAGDPAAAPASACPGLTC